VLEGVVTRVEPFANQVNRIVLDNSRLKQEITWLYRELDFTTQKLMQQQQIINVMASHIGLDELVSTGDGLSDSKTSSRVKTRGSGVNKRFLCGFQKIKTVLL